MRIAERPADEHPQRSAMGDGFQQAAPAVVALAPEPRVPFVIEPKYTKVYLRGYKDEHGRIVGPQEIVQLVDAGGINPDAIDNWDHAYIPANNIVVPPGMGSPVMALAPSVSTPDSDVLANAEDLVITKLYKAEDEPMVISMAKQKGMDYHFDENLGWVLLKRKTTK